MKRALLLVLLLLLSLGLLVACDDKKENSGSQTDIPEIPDAEIAAYVGGLTDATATLTVSDGEGETTYSVQLSDDRAEIVFSDGEEVVKNRYFTSGEYAYLFLDDGIFCEKTDRPDGATTLSFFLDRVEKSLKEFDLGRDFYWKKCVSNADGKISFSYEKSGFSITGSVEKIGETTVSDGNVAVPEYAAIGSADDFDPCAVHASCVIDGQVSVGLSFLFDGQKARLDILFYALGVWNKQTNYLLPENGRLYFYSDQEGWQYTDLVGEFAPENVVKITAELLLVASDLDLTAAFGDGCLCTMDGEEGMFFCRFFSTEDRVILPEATSSSKERAERIVNY